VTAIGTKWTLSPEIEAEIAEIAAACGCELIHAEWKGGVLRLVLDRPPAETPTAVAAEASRVRATAAAGSAISAARSASLRPIDPATLSPSALVRFSR